MFAPAVIEYNKITDIFCIIDEFCQNFKQNTESFILANKPKRSSRMSESEVISILMLFHLGGFRCLKHF